MDARFVRQKAQLATMRGWEVALFAEDDTLRDAVQDRSLRLEELAGRRDWLPVPKADRGSQLKKDDDRAWARQHGDFTVQHQAGSRLIAAFEHLVDHSEGWRVHGQLPPFHVYPEFAVLRGALEATAAAWWLLEPANSADRVLRALSSKKQEVHYEAQAIALKYDAHETADSFIEDIKSKMTSAAQEVGSDTVVKFPNFSTMADSFGGAGKRIRSRCLLARMLLLRTRLRLDFVAPSRRPGREHRALCRTSSVSPLI